MKYRVKLSGREHEVTLIARTETGVHFQIGDQRYDVEVRPDASERRAPGGGPAMPIAAPKVAAPVAKGALGEIRAPMPGIVVQVIAAVGAEVALGAPLVVIEAMKMENSITATKAGRIEEVAVAAGQQVNGGDLLVRIV